MKNIIIAFVLFSLCINATYINKTNKVVSNTDTDKRLEYLIGDWNSTGFVTDDDGFNQYIEINQHVESKGEGLQFTVDGINPHNSYRYKTTKTIYYDAKKKAWYVKGIVKNKFVLDCQVTLTDVNTVTYTYYDEEKNVMRFSIIKENDNMFVETEEKWTTNGWDKTAWLRMQRSLKTLKGLDASVHPTHE